MNRPLADAPEATAGREADPRTVDLGQPDPRAAVAHLTPERWARANRLLAAKALSEFSHERLLAPRLLPTGDYAVPADDRTAEYRFSARRLPLDHWVVDPDSITRHQGGRALPDVDALTLVTEVRGALGLTDEVLPLYLEELTSTLAGTAFKLAGDPLPAAELARADFQTIEAGMTEGHPSFVANNGRIGFDAAEYPRFAPEAGAPVRLIWTAVRRDRSVFTSCPGLDHDRLMADELGAATLARFRATLAADGLDPDDYRLIPVHPWQWWNKLSVVFAPELARRTIVCLGHGEDTYRAQQSIRTLFNVDEPSRHYVKTALSVLNMGFMRGLPTDYVQAMPAVNTWLADLFASDDVLKATGFSLLRELAATGYLPRYYPDDAPGSPYRGMLAALWRESPVPALEPGQRLATMASLLHVDAHGDPLVGALIAESGLSPAA
ncbi:IucA/IucC family protein, partial [Streptomyces sp. URMC 123]|uniref:IucA/IucC family protein n=1 Tax=Streptomyces sp. URMC 123 TaxID=3423403 RepID=UPI003F19EE50